MGITERRQYRFRSRCPTSHMCMRTCTYTCVPHRRAGIDATTCLFNAALWASAALADGTRAVALFGARTHACTHARSHTARTHACAHAPTHMCARTRTCVYVQHACAHTHARTLARSHASAHARICGLRAGEMLDDERTRTAVSEASTSGYRLGVSEASTSAARLRMMQAGRSVRDEHS